MQAALFQSEEVSKFNDQRCMYSVIYVLTLLQAGKVCSKMGQRGQFLCSLNISADTSVVKVALAWEMICLHRLKPGI